jgi:hypothetical protein
MGEGSVRAGARGNFTVDMDWKTMVNKAIIRSNIVVHSVSGLMFH